MLKGIFVVRSGINQLSMMPITAKIKPKILSKIPPIIKVRALKIKIMKNAREIF